MQLQTLLRRGFATASALALMISPLASQAMTMAPPMVSNFNPGDLIKGSGDTVYYFAPTGKRFVFPNAQTYFTWYTDFSNVKTIPDSHLSTIPLGGNVTYRPGKKMIKITTDPKVYVVDRGGVLRWVASEQLAQQLYGLSWSNQIDDVPDPFFVNYHVGTPIQNAADYIPSDALTLTTNIAQDKNMDLTKVTITIGGTANGFVPTSFTVRRGTQVVWTNNDNIAHTVTGASFDSGMIQPGQTFSRTFNAAGSYDYHCTLHPGTMQGTVNVIN